MPASFNDIPVEIFEMICDHLESYADIESLRLTCTSFKNIMPPSSTRSRYDRYGGFTRGREQRSRLLREGNIFSGMNVSMCGKCLHVKSKPNFPIKGLTVENYEICCECIVDVLHWTIGETHPIGKTMNYGGKSWWQCLRCDRKGDGDEMVHDHEDCEGQVFNFCEDCHMRDCGDAACKGWPSGYNPVHMDFLRKRAIAEAVGGRFSLCRCEWCMAHKTNGWRAFFGFGRG